MRTRRSKEEWAALLREQKESGKSVAKYCQGKGIHPNLFYHKIRMTKSSASIFVKVAVPYSEHRAIAIQAGQMTIHVPRPIFTKELIQVLQCAKEVFDA